MTEIALTTDSIHQRGLMRRSQESLLRRIVAIDQRLTNIEAELEQLSSEVRSLWRELEQEAETLTND